MRKTLLQTMPIFILIASLSAVGKDPGFQKGKKSPYLSQDAHRVPTAEQVKTLRLERELKKKLEGQIEREIRAAKESMKHKKLEELRKSRKTKKEEPKNVKFRKTLRKSAKWQRFSHPGKFPKNWDRLGTPSTRSGPTVLVNGATSATIDAGEPFEFSITFSAGSGDSALIDLFFDLDGDGAVGDDDISLFSILFFKDDGPGDPEWIYDNSPEDEDPTEGVFVVTIDDFPFMGISIILQATDTGGPGQAILTVNNLTGDYSASGTVTPTTAPAIVFFSSEFDDEPFMTFSDESGAFSFGFHDRGMGFHIGAMDVVLGNETGGYLFHGISYKDAEELSGITIDITRDAEAPGTVTEEDGSAIEGAWVDMFSGGFYEILVGFAISDTNGEFTIPLQGGNLYDGAWSDHPDYMGDNCIDYPIYVQTGDVVDVSCVLKPWPAFVEGYVTDSETGDPIEDIDVSISIWQDDGPFFEDMWNDTWTDENGYYRLGSIYGEGIICAIDWEWREYQGYCIEPFVVDQPLVTQDFELDPFDGAIEGTVTDASTGEPIGGADVYAFSDEMGHMEHMDFFMWDITDQDGKYLIPAMNGTYTVCASKWWEWHDETCVDNVTVVNDTATANIALEPPDGFIQGYVYDVETNDPIEGIGVEAISDFNGMSTAIYTRTDENGFFKIGVNNGTYEVCYYDWTNTYEDTCISDITVSDDTQELDMYLTPIDWDGAIAGAVTNQFGDPVLAMVWAVDTLIWEGNGTMTDENGEYVLPLNNGNYVAIAEPFRWGYLSDVKTGITVNDDTVQVDFVTVVVQIDAMVKGAVTDTLENPIKGAFVAAEAWGGPFQWGPHFETETDASGTYGLGVMGFDDRYYWVYGGYWNDDTDEWWAGGQDSVSVGSGDTVTVDLTLAPIVYSSSISGHVSRQGEPIVDVEVTAFNHNTDEFYVTYTDDHGFYSMGVSNGEYDVCVYEWESDMNQCHYVSVWDEDAIVNFRFGPPVEFVPNMHGNFRFSWSNYGKMTDWDYDYENEILIPLGPNGEWPAGFGRHYLYGGGLLVSGFSEHQELMMGGVYSGGWMPGKRGIAVEAPQPFEIITRHMVDAAGWMPTHLKLKEVIITQDDKDVLIIGTRLRYDGPGTMTHVRAGYFFDWDLAYSERTSDSEFWQDDLAGSMSVTITDPFHGTAIPLTVSYMMDDDKDMGASPGYVGMATLYEPGVGVNHISLDAKETEDYWFPSDVDMMEILQSGMDSPDETETSDYRVMQSSDAVDLSTGDVFKFVTVLMATESLDQFQGLLQDAMETVISHMWQFTADIAEDEAPLPTKYTLYQNHPNPFNPVTTIRYDLPEEGDVHLTVYDMLGRKVAILVNRRQAPGNYTAIWSGKDQSGREAATGVYIYQLKAGDFVGTKKFILLK